MGAVGGVARMSGRGRLQAVAPDGCVSAAFGVCLLVVWELLLLVPHVALLISDLFHKPRESAMTA